MKASIRPAVLILLCLASFLGTACQASALHGALPAALADVTDFTLPDQFGQPYALSERRGKVVLMFFGYTNCPDECPTTLGDFKRVQTSLGERARRVQVLFITIDPEQDTPGLLQRYMAQFDGSFHALRGDGEALAEVKDAYGAVGEKAGALDGKSAYSMFHTNYMYMIGPAGRVETVYSYGTKADLIVQDIISVLAKAPM